MTCPKLCNKINVLLAAVSSFCAIFFAMHPNHYKRGKKGSTVRVRGYVEGAAILKREVVNRFAFHDVWQGSRSRSDFTTDGCNCVTG